jgi:hypothetical protein
MMSHGLDVPKAAFQRAGCSDRSRSRKATSELHRLYRAAHRVGTCKQKVRFLPRRVGLTIKAPLPRFSHGMEKQLSGACDRADPHRKTAPQKQLGVEVVALELPDPVLEPLRHRAGPRLT